MHYQRLTKAGDLTKGRLKRQHCMVEGCNRPIVSRKYQLCRFHYYRFRRYGDVHARERFGQAKNHPEYSIWQAMLNRCRNPNVRGYEDYGGRGIKACERWKHDFWAFLDDMGERPEGYSLDRINSNGNYEPDNCRWVPLVYQAQNKRGVQLDKTLVAEIRRRHEAGESGAKIARELGLSYNAVLNVIKGKTWTNV